VSSKFRSQEAVADLLHSGAIRVVRMVRVEDSKAGIGPAQLSALSVLVFLGAKTVNELAVIEQVRPPTMSRIVDGLVKEDLVDRTTAAGDRRFVSVVPTRKGRKLLLEGKARRVRALAKRFDGLTNAELSTLEKAAGIMARL
jgi:DNA-binding MarR family transcriptional regulator